MAAITIPNYKALITLSGDFRRSYINELSNLPNCIEQIMRSSNMPSRIEQIMRSSDMPSHIKQIIEETRFGIKERLDYTVKAMAEISPFTEPKSLERVVLIRIKDIYASAQDEKTHDPLPRGNLFPGDKTIMIKQSDLDYEFEDAGRRISRESVLNTLARLGLLECYTLNRGKSKPRIEIVELTLLGKGLAEYLASQEAAATPTAALAPHTVRTRHRPRGPYILRT